MVVALPLIAALFMLRKLYPMLLDYRETRALVAKYRKDVDDDDVSDTSELLPYMQKTINERIRDKKRNDLETIVLRQAQLTAFQNQINPHFLYNTLDSVRGDVISNGLTDTAEMIEALSKFFRYSLSSSTNVISFREELENVNNYMKIMEYRFGKRISLNTVSDDYHEILEYQLPKLTLQPLVENAIKYGLENRKSGGSITIRFLHSDTHVSISVEDNGIGIDPQSLKQINSGIQGTVQSTSSDFSRSSGVALRNVSERIRLLFGPEYGIHINSIVGHGTEVIVNLPPLDLAG